MPETFKSRLVSLLRRSEKYTKTDMVYLASGGFWLVLEQVAAALFALALAALFGHYASQDTYGNYKYIIALAGLFGVLIFTGLPTAVAQATARGFEGALRQGARLTFRYAWIFALACFLGAAYYLFADHNRFVAIGLVLVAFVAPLQSGFALFDSFLLGRKEFRTSTRYAVIGNLVLLAALAVTLFLTQRAIALVFAYFVTQAATAFFFYRATIHQAHNAAEDPEMLRYGLHLSAMGVLSAVADKIDSIIVFTLLGPAQLAVYAYAIAVPEQLKGVVKQVMALSLPRFAERPLRDIRKTAWVRIAFFMAVIAAFAFLYIALAPFLFRYLFPVYRSATSYSQWYALIIIITGIPAVIVSVLQAHRRIRELYVTRLVGSVVLLVTLPFLAYAYGIAGAIAAQALYRAANALAAAVVFTRLKDADG